MPTAQEVCEQQGLTDVDLEYTELDYQKLTNFHLFQQTIRPRIQAENVGARSWKLVMDWKVERVCQKQAQPRPGRIRARTQ